MQMFASYEEENIDYWTKRTPGYLEVNQGELASRQRAVWSSVISQRIAARFPGKTPDQIKVLDVGTGPGFFAVILTELGYRVAAVDYTASMLKAAKENAGSLAAQISFYQMNAEELDFPDNSFDVLVTRNLTWNLRHPKKAYARWTRVLKKGGLLLNFDAGWYRYLYDADAKKGHLQDRVNIAYSNVGDETEGTDVAAMESIARKAPLSARKRPEWDLDILRELEMEALADTEIWKQVWTREERINNASTPMFLIEARKEQRHWR